MPLSKFPATFGISELEKGFFPHLFNRKENWDYVGHIPDIQHFGIEGMNPKMREKVIEWHEAQKGKVWSFREEMEKYCKSDVLILQQGCRIFRELVMQVTANAQAEPREDEGEQINVDMKLGIDPIKKSTIAGAAMNIFRTLFMPEEPIAALQKSVAKKLKRGFVGGRTG